MSAEDVLCKMFGCTVERLREMASYYKIIDAMGQYAAQFKTEWISVKDDQPKPHTEVLGWRPHKEEIIKCYMDEYHAWMFDDGIGSSTVNITYWKPLPTIPNK